MVYTRKKINRVSFLLCFWLLACASVFAGSEIKEPESLPLTELKAFTEAYYQIKSAYIEDVDDTTLIREAIRGMVSSLDAHSRFLPPREFEQFNSESHGEYAGIGMSFSDHKLGIKIERVIMQSPAQRAGLKKGMLVTHINRASLRYVSGSDALVLLQGDVGSLVELTVTSSKMPQPEIIKLTRELIELKSVTSEALPDNAGYISLKQFTLKSVAEFKQAVDRLSKISPLSKLIIDLRDNPGGVMEVAVELSDLFVNNGKLLISTGRIDDANQVYYASEESPLKDIKVVILINEGSASASEIMAAALKDHNKATILGETSYGKGSIQSIIPLNHQSGLKLTTAEYFSPAGEKIQDKGVIPDVSFSTKKIKNPYSVSLLDDPEILQAYNLLTKNNMK